MRSSASTTVDIVMLGSFGVWTRGTLQSRALPLARAVTNLTDLRLAIVTTPWDAPDQAGVCEQHDNVQIYNTSAVKQRQAFAITRQQISLVRRLRPSIIHVMKPKASAGMTADLLLRAGTSASVVIDYDDWEGDGGWNDRSAYPLPARRLFAYQEQQLLRAADAVTAASTLLEVRARRLRGGPGHEVTFLPNGLGTDWLKELSSLRKEITAPRLVLYSRFAEFSAAWLATVLHTIDRRLQTPLELDIIGDSDHSRLQSSQFDQLRLVWHGFVPRPEIPGLLGTATIALYPYDDNLINQSKQSVKLLELMASGNAIVASDVGDIRRIAGNSVIAVRAGDAETFASEVVRLIENPGLARELSKRARQRVERFTMSRLAETLTSVYSGLR